MVVVATMVANQERRLEAAAALVMPLLHLLFNEDEGVRAVLRLKINAETMQLNNAVEILMVKGRQFEMLTKKQQCFRF